MPQLICRDLTLGYDGKTVISGLSFSIERGDYLCVIGDNGSGKSTLMKAILRLITPSSGRIIGGGDGGIGYLPQQTAVTCDFPASVGEIVLSGFLRRRGLRPFYSKSEKQTAKEYMYRFGIAGLAGRCFRELSGGQRQRVFLARAMCAAGGMPPYKSVDPAAGGMLSPDESAQGMLLLDEPAAGLDPQSAAGMYEHVCELNRGGMTVVMISHDIEAVAKYASHILEIRSGRATVTLNKKPL